MKTRSWRPYNNQGKVLPMRYSAVADLHVKFADFQALAQYVSGLVRRQVPTRHFGKRSPGSADQGKGNG